MSRKKIAVAVVLLNMIWSAGCGQILNASIGMEVNTEENAAYSTQRDMYKVTKLDNEVDCANATQIEIDQLKENRLFLDQGGDYLLSGKNSNCNIIIDTYDDELVHLFLKDVELGAQEGPAIYVEKAGKVVITVLEDTENIILDSSEYASETEACIFSNADLTINGSGRLSVYGYYHDAIRSKDRLKLVKANLYVKAKNDGLRGNDGIIIENSDIEIESEGTGILTKSESGYIVIRGGKCKIISGENAIAADNFVGIYDCNKDLYSVLEAVKCNGNKEIEEEH
ncbi:MAG: carbohydrate-binding domain-containing protein [Lachnospiraceae bacterium]|nr:carbohydrate-binding domain-containing protein [Lachnospiraceae bacterium]MDD7628513.1 carbohydrate-binding domain-containing protein [Lachnospiraceae bacterium]MDY4120039.1 carbohydrate-binding domain-containing protein [Lachnospiraceae bacterium]